MARKPKNYKPIEFRQLCAVVKMLLQQDPTIDDAELKARTRDRLEKLGFDEPSPDTLSNAMTQVEQALKLTIGPRRIGRPIPEPIKAGTDPKPDLPKEARTNQPAGWDIVASLMAKLHRGAGSTSSSPAPSGPRETLDLTEEYALDTFWQRVREGADKLEMLRAFAEIAILRPEDWDYEGGRAHAHEHHLSHHGCFVCQANGVIDWHHVIQIQFGGSNYFRNRVPLCDACHRAVHPWLPQSGRHLPSWSSSRDLSFGFIKTFVERRRA